MTRIANTIPTTLLLSGLAFASSCTPTYDLEESYGGTTVIAPAIGEHTVLLAKDGGELPQDVFDDREFSAAMPQKASYALRPTGTDSLLSSARLFQAAIRSDQLSKVAGLVLTERSCFQPNDCFETSWSVDLGASKVCHNVVGATPAFALECRLTTETSADGQPTDVELLEVVASLGAGPMAGSVEWRLDILPNTANIAIGDVHELVGWQLASVYRVDDMSWWQPLQGFMPQLLEGGEPAAKAIADMEALLGGFSGELVEAPTGAILARKRFMNRLTGDGGLTELDLPSSDQLGAPGAEPILRATFFRNLQDLASLTVERTEKDVECTFDLDTFEEVCKGVDVVVASATITMETAEERRYLYGRAATQFGPVPDGSFLQVTIPLLELFPDDDIVAGSGWRMGIQTAERTDGSIGDDSKTKGVVFMDAEIIELPALGAN